MSDAPIWRELGLRDEEYDRIVQLMGREPNLTELGMFAALWSEHCAYKHSRHLFSLFPTEGPQVLQSLGQNAGVVDIGDGLAITFKIESHNHPSAVEPFHGAATGVGGILRDIISMGARPIAVLGSLRLGPLDDPKVRFLFRGITAGMSDYADTAGVPIVGAEVGFDPLYRLNPLVNVMAIGVVAHEHIATAYAQGVGNPVMVAGAATGRDGILGAGFASTDLEEDKAPSQTQIGDPFKAKLLIEACLEVIQEGLVAGIQDMGAAGLTSSTSEMAAKAGTGIDLDLLKVPRREEGMTPYELMLSESQERMLIVPKKGAEGRVKEIFEKWGLDAVVVGEVTEDGVLRVREGDQTAAAVPAAFLTTDEAPSYIIEPKRPSYIDDFAAVALPLDITGDASDTLLRLLADPNVASKSWVLRQADHSIGGRTVGSPESADAAMLWLRDYNKGLAATVDCNALHCMIDPRVGAAAAVARAARKLVSTGAQPLALTDGMNFGNPEKPEISWQFSEAVHGIAEAARALGTPVIGGNVSFYNETKDGAIMPTSMIGMVGLVPSVDHFVTRGFKQPTDRVFLLGRVGGFSRDLGGSRYLAALHGVVKGPLPHLDLDDEIRLQRLMIEACDRRLLKSAHTVSDGGLAVSLAQSALIGGLGIRCDWTVRNGDASYFPTDDHDPRRYDALLFGEGYGRIVVSVAEHDVAALESLALKYNVSCVPIGEVVGGDFDVTVRIDDGAVRSSDSSARETSADDRSVTFNLSLAQLADAWRGAISQAMQAE